MPRRFSPLSSADLEYVGARDPSRPPWWITLLDVLSLVLLACATRVLIAGRFRVGLGVTLITIGSSLRVVLWLAAALVLRHLLWRRSSWLARMGAWARAVVRDEAIATAGPVFLVSRALALGAGYFAVAMIGFNPPRPWRALPSDWWDLFARWDGGWYYYIASAGYHASHAFNPMRQNAIAFFPGLPLLMRLFGTLLGVNYWVAGIVVVLVAFFFALVLVYRLAREDLTADQARAAVMFLAFYPFAVCYSAVLTESLFLLAAAGAFLFFRRDRLLLAAIFGLLAGIVRPNGFLLCVPLGLLALIPFARARGWLPNTRVSDDPRWTRLFVKLGIAAVPVVSLLAYCWYVYSLTGDPFAWAKAQQAWGRSTAVILNLIQQRTALIAESGWAAYARQNPTELLEGGAAIFGLVAVWPIVRRFGLAYGVFVALAILPPFITMGSISLGRYTAPLFPIFFWLGAAVPERRRPYWIATFGAGQALVATLFYTWRPPY